MGPLGGRATAARQASRHVSRRVPFDTTGRETAGCNIRDPHAPRLPAASKPFFPLATRIHAAGIPPTLVHTPSFWGVLPRMHCRAVVAVCSSKPARKRAPASQVCAVLRAKCTGPGEAGQSRHKDWTFFCPVGTRRRTLARRAFTPKHIAVDGPGASETFATPQALGGAHRRSREMRGAPEPRRASRTCGQWSAGTGQAKLAADQKSGSPWGECEWTGRALILDNRTSVLPSRTCTYTSWQGAVKTASHGPVSGRPRPLVLAPTKPISPASH